MGEGAGIFPVGGLDDVRSATTMVRVSLGAVIALVACTGGGYDATDPATTGTTVAPHAMAVLFVQRTEGGVTQDVQVGARFVRVAGIADDALPDLVGMPWAPSTGSCVERSLPAATGDASRAEVRLLDVGPVDVHAGEVSLRLYPRRFPDLWNVVSGVLYGVEEGTMPQGRWRFTGVGDPTVGVGGFDVEASAPDDLTGVRLGDVPLPSPPGTAVILHHGALPVRWNRGYTEDKVAVVFEGSSTLVCGARDEGWLDVDAPTMDRVAEILRAGGNVSVHRQRSSAFSISGVDTGTMVFDLAARSLARVE